MTTAMRYPYVDGVYQALDSQVAPLLAAGWILASAYIPPVRSPFPPDPYGPLRPLDFGAVGDGITDDTFAIKSMLASISRTADGGLAARVIDLGPFTYLITDTVTISYRDLQMRGHGIGNPANTLYGPGKGTVFRWGGTSGVPMFQVVDSMHVAWSDIYFQGNSTPEQRPSELIYLPGGGTAGTNYHMSYKRLRFGSLPWSTPGTTGAGKTCDFGIRYGGTNSNNDRPFLEDVQFEDCGVGFKLDNSQSIWGSCKDVVCTNCTTGIDTSAALTCTNINFQGCVTDMRVRSTARVVVVGWGSENSQLILDKPDPSGSVVVTGGLWLLQTAAMQAGGKVINVPNLTDTGVLMLQGVSVRNEGGLSPKPKLYVHRGVAGGDNSQLVITACAGVQLFTDLDVLCDAGTMRVSIDSLGMRAGQTLTAGQSPSPSTG